MNLRKNIPLLTILLIFVVKNNLSAQVLLDSTLLKTAITTKQCIEEPKKYIGKEIAIQGLIVGSTEVDISKMLVYVLTLDDSFPLNKVSILVTEADADILGFSRYTYHNRRAIVKGKLVKNKKFKDDFGNPRYTIMVKDLDQIVLY